MHRFLHFYYIIVALLLSLTSCSTDSPFDHLPEGCDPIPLKGIVADIDNGRATRAVTPLVDSIGKYGFLNTDEITFTTIQRTKHPIDGFSYKGVQYSCTAEGGNVSWKRDNPEDDIYWSDGSEPHTFIGYILPHADASSAKASGYDWNYDDVKDEYYGSVGDPTDAQSIDYTATPGLPNYDKAYDLEKLRMEDLLLTYSTEMQNEDGMAKVHFHHGLASVRIVVTIVGFSSTGKDPDAETKVSDMIIRELPTMYKWNNRGFRAAPLVEGDQATLAKFNWGDGKTAPMWNQKKDIKLWQSREYRGSGAGRTFTFYGIVAPNEQQEVIMDFCVSYPDPLDPTSRLEKPYRARLKFDSKNVEFRPGYCTNITINLNHKDEKMTVGAEYMSWQFDNNPDNGKLRKNSTYLSTTSRDSVTIAADDAKATLDDATWLYNAGTAAAPVIKDIYGGTGTQDNPYLIKTADQLLSFAYEVKSGRDFVHQFVKLDADITMQPSKDVAADKRVQWIGIGDDTHLFNGFFLGSGRNINNLYGDHFFYTIGDNAVIDKLNFNDVIELQGCGVIAHKNLGLICGCYISGDVKETDHHTYTGSIVGENDSFIIGCAHVGKVQGTGTIGGLVGFNNGTIMACYHSGEVIGTGANPDVHATVGKRGDGTGGTNNSIMFSCYFDENLISHTPTLDASKSGFPLSTLMMQSNDFVNGKKDFVYDRNVYWMQSQTLKEVLWFLLYPDQPYDNSYSEQTLMNQLVAQGLTGRVNEVFAYHFSLNEAINAFTLWTNAIAETLKDKSEDAKIQTNCHEFTKRQVLFLQQHYSNTAHRYLYTPAAYPKVQ